MAGSVHGRQSSATPLGFSFSEVASSAGLSAITVYGGIRTNRYLLETTGSGAAAFDYERDGTFEDVSAKAGLALTGWGQAACAGDYDNDGREDLFVTFFGTNRLFHNRGDGTFDDVTRRAGLETVRSRWGAGCAFLDYDR